jgi:NitT/TauT family transport system permease protein
VVPILVIWFGIGTIPAIITAFAISFFPIVVNVATGLATIEPELRDVLRSVGASKTQILTKVGIPRSLPYLFASFKIAITLAFIGSIVSETVASNEGIGYLMLAAHRPVSTSRSPSPAFSLSQRWASYSMQLVAPLNAE